MFRTHRAGRACSLRPSRSIHSSGHSLRGTKSPTPARQEKSLTEVRSFDSREKAFELRVTIAAPPSLECWAKTIAYDDSLVLPLGPSLPIRRSGALLDPKAHASGSLRKAQQNGQTDGGYALDFNHEEPRGPRKSVLLIEGCATRQRLREKIVSNRRPNRSHSALPSPP